MSRRVYFASFGREEDVVKAAREMRLRGYRLLDVFTPYPVHGLDEAMGLKASRLPIACFIFGLTGALAAFLFQSWVSASDWPMVIGGKPFWVWPSFIPVTFELTVLFAGLGSVASLFFLRKLFPWRKPRFEMKRATDDRFVAAVERADASFDEAAFDALCLSCGALDVEEREEDFS
jgi:hypothetical protein